MMLNKHTFVTSIQAKNHETRRISFFLRQFFFSEDFTFMKESGINTSGLNPAGYQLDVTSSGMDSLREPKTVQWPVQETVRRFHVHYVSFFKSKSAFCARFFNISYVTPDGDRPNPIKPCQFKPEKEKFR